MRSRHAAVEHVPIGREVSELPVTRQEGNVIIVPVVEEVLVVTKKLVLKEEIHLRFVDSEESVEQLTQRRVQRATVERLVPEQAASPAGTAEWTDNTKGRQQ
ncbi:DUF2382 domain-containing protein [Roseomonas nepalensis]|uniref:DUF2382 domain-containing protein n=1 Tax=Muricoccus nepalensis TaxID=1854500 RepID=A0A502F5M2_9PROT|nr:DUF2382 domain-containing protein [Roseomonas nepalensis]TPG44309.1 DUF2382 domain-containing protein [Roseomonas nepalensis]